MQLPEDALEKLFETPIAFGLACENINRNLNDVGRTRSFNEVDYISMGRLMLYNMLCQATQRPDRAAIQIAYTNLIVRFNKLQTVDQGQRPEPLLSAVEIPFESRHYDRLEQAVLSAQATLRSQPYPKGDGHDIWEWLQQVITELLAPLIEYYDREESLDLSLALKDIFEVAVLTPDEPKIKPQTVYGYSATPHILIPPPENPFMLPDLLHEVGHALHIDVSNNENQPPNCEIDPLVGESVAQAITMYGLMRLRGGHIVPKQMNRLMHVVFIGNAGNRFNSKLHFLSTVIGCRLATSMRTDFDLIIKIMNSGSKVSLTNLGIDEESKFNMEYLLSWMTDRFLIEQTC